MHAWPPVVSGAAHAFGLNAKAIPHNPAPATTTPMLNRPKIGIAGDSFIHVPTFRLACSARSMPSPRSPLDDRVNYQQLF
jgi:hypothetical protein